MTRKMAFLSANISAQISDAQDLAELAEGSTVFLYSRRLFIYEAAYLLTFSAWENLLEQSFLRFLAGYENSAGVAVRNGMWRMPRTLQDAYITMLNGRQYALWHNPNLVVNRSRNFFVNGPHESVVSSALSDIEDFAAIRHYVAHRNHETEQKFQAAATRLTGTRVVGARAGRLLRSVTTDTVTGAQITWLDRIGLDLCRYASQIVG